MTQANELLGIPATARRWISAYPLAYAISGYAALGTLSLAILLHGLGDYGILNGNESLYVEAAREMALSGNWAIPTLDGLPYLEKPPLFVWLIVAANHFVSSTELAPRLVSTSAALILIFGVARFSVILRIGKLGVAAAFILVTSVGLIVMSRVAMPDLLLASLFALACLSFLAGVEYDGRRYVRIAGGLLGVASLIKGALPITLFVLIVSAFYVLHPDRRLRIRTLAADPVAAALILLPMSLWLLAIESALPGAASHVIVNEHVQRFLGTREPHDYYSGSIFYYVPRLFLFFFPWAGMLALGWLASSRDPARERPHVRRFLWLCVWIPFGFFTISSAKANYYIILCLPAMALLTADYLPHLLRQRDRFHLAMAVVIPIMIFVAIWAFRIWQIRHGNTSPIAPLRDGSGPLTIGILIVLSLLVLLLIQGGWRRQAVLCLGGLVVPVLFQIDHMIQRAEPFISARLLAAYVRANFGDRPDIFLFKDFEAIGGLPIYLKSTIPVIDSESNDLYFGRHAYPYHSMLVAGITANHPGALIVVAEDRQSAFAGTDVAEHASQLITVGRTKLYVVDR